MRRFILSIAVLNCIHWSGWGAYANEAPIVDAGLDQTINLPGIATLHGTITDDGLPGPPFTLLRSWYKVNGPGDVAFGSPREDDTTVTFSKPGSYVLALGGFDGELLGTNLVTITATAFVRSTPPWIAGTLIPNVFALHHQGATGMHGDWLPHYESIATIKITTSGNWSDIFGETPPSPNDVVLIPPGVVVVYDVDRNTGPKTIVVQGTLAMAPAKSTQLKIGRAHV